MDLLNNIQQHLQAIEAAAAFAAAAATVSAKQSAATKQQQQQVFSNHSANYGNATAPSNDPFRTRKISSNRRHRTTHSLHGSRGAKLPTAAIQQSLDIRNQQQQVQRNQNKCLAKFSSFQVSSNESGPKPLDLSIKTTGSNNNTSTQLEICSNEQHDPSILATNCLLLAKKASSTASSPFSTSSTTSSSSSSTNKSTTIASSAANVATSNQVTTTTTSTSSKDLVDTPKSLNRPPSITSHRQTCGTSNKERKKKSNVIQRNHLCQYCGRSFSRSDMLTRHSRLHSGLKPYQCNKCLQVFSRSDHLSTHERTHTGEKPYQCNFCCYSACRRDMITRHMRTHIGHQARHHQAATVDSADRPKCKI